MAALACAESLAVWTTDGKTHTHPRV